MGKVTVGGDGTSATAGLVHRHGLAVAGGAAKSFQAPPKGWRAARCRSSVRPHAAAPADALRQHAVGLPAVAGAALPGKPRRDGALPQCHGDGAAIIADAT